jgi:superfamily I DNA and/or RNA helicase
VFNPWISEELQQSQLHPVACSNQAHPAGCRAQPADFDPVVISSVDAYQGREADVVVFSTVRCNQERRLGFVADPRRLNVAITRPRR